MNREVLGSNPGPDRKNVRIRFRPSGIPWGVNSRSNLRISIRFGSRLWNDKQTNVQTNKQTNKPTLLFLPRLFDGKDPSANAAGNPLNHPGYPISSISQRRRSWVKACTLSSTHVMRSTFGNATLIVSRLIGLIHSLFFLYFCS